MWVAYRERMEGEETVEVVDGEESGDWSEAIVCMHLHHNNISHHHPPPTSSSSSSLIDISLIRCNERDALTIDEQYPQDPVDGVLARGDVDGAVPAAPEVVGPGHVVGLRADKPEDDGVRVVVGGERKRVGRWRRRRRRGGGGGGWVGGLSGDPRVRIGDVLAAVEAVVVDWRRRRHRGGGAGMALAVTAAAGPPRRRRRRRRTWWGGFFLGEAEEELDGGWLSSSFYFT